MHEITANWSIRPNRYILIGDLVLYAALQKEKRVVFAMLKKVSRDDQLNVVTMA